jgi:transcriptional regulator with XRE-family HTH domain
MPSRSALIREFRDEEYRNTYVDAFLDSSIAAQIRVLRKARGLKQAQLANLIGTKQSGVSQLENVNYSRWNIRTLKALAKALDVALVVKFVSFGEALADIENFSKNALVKPTFAQDPTFLNIEAQAASAMTAVLVPVVPAHIQASSHRSHTRANYLQAGQTVGDLLSSPQV